jgi:hypothetical protein
LPDASSADVLRRRRRPCTPYGTPALRCGSSKATDTKADGPSSKHRKAETMIANGTFIRIVGDSDFMPMVRAKPPPTGHTVAAPRPDDLRALVQTCRRSRA